MRGRDLNSSYSCVTLEKEQYLFDLVIKPSKTLECAN